METNDIRNYNEITNTGIKPSNKYIEKILHLRTDEDRDACLRFLTIVNTITKLCHGLYSPEYMNSIIEDTDFCIYFHEQNNTKEVVAFALVELKSKSRGKIVSIQLACAIPNKNKFGKMIAHSLYNFAVKHKYPFLYVSPRTPELRKTFIKYGFESIHGKEGIDEVLEKEINLNLLKINRSGTTRKVKRPANTLPEKVNTTE